MRISRRPSGSRRAGADDRTASGRGEYEISENTAEGVTPTDLVGRRLLLDFGGGLVVDTGATLRHQGGKFRIRRLTTQAIHPHRQVAAALLMPYPVREDFRWGRGAPIMRAGQYGVEHIQLERADVAADVVRLSVGDLVLRNATYAADDLNLTRRLASVRELWRSAAKFPDQIRGLIERHEVLVTAGSDIPEEAEQIIDEIQKIVTEARDEFGVEYRSQAEDVLPDLLKSLKWAEEPPDQPTPVDDIPPEEAEIRRRVIKDWKRWASYRGAKSARFRQDVRNAYNSTCIVCGLHLPPTAFNSVAGVDAAHILPWASYDLDVVANGVCLCKQHHWAFDEGLLLITWDGERYNVEVPEDIVAELREHNAQFSIDELIKYAGPLPDARLPKQTADRPRPMFLKLFVETLKSGGS